MHALAATGLLAIWERDRGTSLGDRAVAMLAAAGVQSPGRLPVGERDLLLLELRERTFGPRFAAVAVCPECGERLDVELTAADIRDAAGAPAELSVDFECGGRTLTVRVPTAEDLAAAARAGDVAAGREALLARCVPEVDAVDSSAVAARLAAADPAARIDVALACPACGHDWSVAFDIVSFLCAEVDSCARRLLHEIHVLASAYGWREGDVLALGADRRAAYLDLVGA